MGGSKMKTLYVSDLDGTLLNADAELSSYTVETLNRLISSGAYFSVATARTAATTLFILEDVKVNVPIILMNGVLVYDIQSRQYIKKEVLSRTLTAQITAAIKKTGQNGLMYAVQGNELHTYYERLEKEPLKAFVDERIQKYNKRFEQISDFDNVDAGIIYFCFLDGYENIRRLYDEIKNIGGLRVEMYKDIYSDDFWYLEIFSETASKYNAIQFLRQKYGFEKLVCFGDNLNDLPMFDGCDECYAVANAKPELKERATAVIGSNTEDGVARFLDKNVL
ncbi:MAG: Cof-type HAD-IIB family hydrolase [Clostridiaceae bacterium]|jgi:Cof subfamily protein (haloacid dehalogenase superfamily)|nr:Cof-type HAD-IIB family hydrolase [Clostridiaceae bacterium]